MKFLKHIESQWMQDAETDFNIEVIRTNRKKTISIKVVQEGIQVIVPKRLSKKRIQEVIQHKMPWICKKLKTQSETPPVTPKHYVSGEWFTYLGKDYALQLNQEDSNGELKLQDGQFVLSLSKDISSEEKETFVKEQLCLWYLKYATQELEERTEHYAKTLDVSAKSIKVRQYKSRWGSCSIHHAITYNWQLIIAPTPIVDYVVVHELSHILHHNHSSDFWNCVESVLPDYKERRKWLKKNGKSLNL